jgi:phosphatidylserine decarboxylase
MAGPAGSILAAAVLLQAGLSVWAAALGTLSLLLLLIFLWFFRDPTRNPGLAPGDTMAVAPADGRVIEAREGPEGAVLTIYLTLLNVHVTRLPLDSEIVQVDRIKGGYRPAGGRRGGENTRLITDCRTASGKMQITQFVGFLARRIVPYLTAGQRGVRGARLGLIRFGSRVHVAFPAGYDLLVGTGMRVRAGETPVARLAGSETGRQEP